MNFVKGASLLQSHLFNETAPILGPFAVHKVSFYTYQEFTKLWKTLCEYLGLQTDGMLSASQWFVPPSKIESLTSSLIAGLGWFSNDQWSKIVQLPVLFSRPRLLTPPAQFSKLLMQYVNLNCSFCDRKPKVWNLNRVTQYITIIRKA